MYNTDNIPKEKYGVYTTLYSGHGSMPNNLTW